MPYSGRQCREKEKNYEESHPSGHRPGACPADVMALVLTLSQAVSIQDMNPKDDPLLGTKFSVDATIPLSTTAEGKDISLSIPVSGISKSALEAAVTTGQVELSLLRDNSHPYVNKALFPYAYAGQGHTL